ncbi:hypothetical protein PV379_04545 [Streptomyces caniscabiei]|uniref:hypothetical protein n=1 Tax=Streptomyces caniscabiei TaxID=2746961 RepID=UPI0029A5C512|nr:hypothetical protein [Streptomyces caniscabiei]MDX2776605.1 hypothetical protein [Streptomyces caniscabiei]
MVKKQTPLSIEKILTFTGIMLILLGCIANSYNAATNMRFIHDFLDSIYYLRFVMLLGGGFTIGYLLSKGKGFFPKAMPGVFYALFAVTLYNVFDSLRIVVQHVFGEMTFPWSAFFFEGMPLVALLITVAFLIWSPRKTRSISTAAKTTFVIAFVANQLFLMVTAPVELAWASYILSPLAIFLVAYALFGRVQPMLERNFLAAFIGVVYSTLPVVLWEFQTNPSADATQSYAVVVIVASATTTALLTFLTYKAITKK